MCFFAQTTMHPFTFKVLRYADSVSDRTTHCDDKIKYHLHRGRIQPAGDSLIFNRGDGPMGAPPCPHTTNQHTSHVYLPKDIVAGRHNHNCDVSNSTISFYPVIFLPSQVQLSFYNGVLK